MKMTRSFLASALLSCLIAALALILSSCASLGVSSKGAEYFVGKKEKALAKYFGYEGKVLAEGGKDFDKAAYFSNKYIAAHMDYSNTTYTKSRWYSDINDYEFFQMGDGCYVSMYSSHYEQRYDPGSRAAIVAGGQVIQEADAPQTYRIHRNDNVLVSGWISRFNGNVRNYSAVSSEYNSSLFDSSNIGDRYFIYSITSEYGTLGGEPATRYRYRLRQVDVYMDAQTQSDTQVAYYYSIPHDAYLAADRRTAISKDEALANVSAYQSRGYTLREETGGLALFAFIKDGVVDSVIEAE